MEKFDNLWKYQEAELALEKLETKIRNTPSRIELTKLRTYLTEQQRLLDRIAEEAESKNASVDEMTQRYNTLEAQYSKTIKQLEEHEADLSFDEVKKLRKSVETLLTQVTDERRELYNIMQWCEKLDERLKKVWAQAAKAKKSYDSLRVICEQELEQSQPDLEAAKLAVVQCEKMVDRDLLKKYKAIKRNYVSPMAKVENNQCGGCNMSLPMIVTKRLKDSETPIECENCGRILYMS